MDDTIKYAAAVEILHNATLLHDDVADEADLRRGKPTVRALMGPSVSVLVGDFWLVRAQTAILDCRTEDHERTMRLFAKTLSDLAEGEMLQMQKASSADTTFEDYLRIIYRKTSSIFECACRSAAISVSAPKEYEEAVAVYAQNLGYAFQMRDDIFDYMPFSQVGKPVGVDVMEQKITLPLLCALEGMSEKEQMEVREKVKKITPSGRDEIVGMVRRSGALDRAQQIATEYCGKAVSALGALPQSESRRNLEKIVQFVVNREK